MFKVQEETIRKIVSSCNSHTIVRLDRLSEEIQDNKRLEKLNKETVDLKISLETSQEIFEKKFQKVDDNLSKQKQHKGDINKLWKDNNQLFERLRDLENRSRRDNLKMMEKLKRKMKRGSKQKKSYRIYSKKSNN